MSADLFTQQTMPLGNWRWSGHGIGHSGGKLEAVIFANMLCKQIPQPQTLLWQGMQLVGPQQGYPAGLQEEIVQEVNVPFTDSFPQNALFLEEGGTSS